MSLRFRAADKTAALTARWARPLPYALKYLENKVFP
ncbi:hypothetical protein XHC_0097 [Xanthomonas hortorum pv. carotae str. M081]|nr:hypothetical protein XHC_0097 [Xanthomonas hortorum pv. carotae str. M081]